jgi:hemolysin III
MNSPTAKGTIKSQTCTAMGTVPEEELTTRETRRVRMSPMTARLTAVKSLASYDFSFQPSLDRNRVFAPAQLDFVERRQCVHFLGPPGTGKSASPSPSASRRVKAGKSVYFATLADVVSSTQRAGRRVALNKLPPVCRSETTRSLERSQPMYYREKFNAMAHVVGAVLAVAGAVAFVALAALGGDPWKVVSVAIYGVTLVSLYSISGLYHSLRGRPKDILRELDHQSIYVLIAGSYTPFCLGTLRGPWGWSLLGIVWGLAVLGGLQELRPRNGARILSVLIYLLMGWVAVAAPIPCYTRWARPVSPGSWRAVRSTPSESSSMRSTPA